MNPTRLAPRVVALFLSLVLSLPSAAGYRLREMVPPPLAAAMPSPTYALRSREMSEQTSGLEELEKALAVSEPSAGLEEKEKAPLGILRDRLREAEVRPRMSDQQLRTLYGQRVLNAEVVTRILGKRFQSEANQIAQIIVEVRRSVTSPPSRLTRTAKWAIGVFLTTTLGVGSWVAIQQAQNVPTVQLDTVSNQTLDAYFETVQELSTPGPWGYVNWVNAFPTEYDHEIYPILKDKGGTMVGVSFQHNFTYAVMADPSTYVIYDINPFVTEVMVPLFGHIAEQAPTRREFLSALLGVQLTDEDVKRLLESQKPETATSKNPLEAEEKGDNSLVVYLEKTLREVVNRVPIEKRKEWYRSQIQGVLSNQILPRLNRLGRLKSMQELRRVGDGVPMRMFDRFLNPELILAPGEEHMVPTPQQRVLTPWVEEGIFTLFLENHARHSWYGLPGQTWLSNETQYQKFRRYWMEGRFIGMTADLTSEKDLRKLGRWLKQHGREPVSVIYASNIGEWVGLDAARKMYRVFGSLLLRQDAIILLSDRPILLIGGWSYQRVNQFYNYVDPQEDLVTRYLFGTTQRAEQPFYDGFLNRLGLHHYHAGLFHYKITDEPRRPDVQLDGLRQTSDFEEFIEPAWLKEEYQAYKRLIGHIRKSEKEIQNLDPDEFTNWVQDWIKQNSFSLSTETTYYRALVWNLVDAGIIRSWPKGFVAPSQRPMNERVEGLVRALRDPHPDVRRTSALALNGIGVQAKSAVPALIELLQDEIPAVRESAVIGLSTVGFGTEQVVPALVQVLRRDASTKYFVRDAAAVALGNLSGKDKQAWDALIELLQDANPDVRVASAWSFGHMGIRAQEVGPLLERLREKETDPHVREALEESILRLHGNAPISTRGGLEEVLQAKRATGLEENPVELILQRLEMNQNDLSQALAKVGYRGGIPVNRSAVGHWVTRVKPVPKEVINLLPKVYAARARVVVQRLRVRLRVSPEDLWHALAEKGFKGEAAVPSDVVIGWEDGTIPVPFEVLDLLPRIYEARAPVIIRQMRESLRLSQEELGQELRRSASMVSLWEAGKRPIPGEVLDTLQALPEKVATGLEEWPITMENLPDFLVGYIASQIKGTNESAEVTFDGPGGPWIEKFNPEQDGNQIKETIRDFLPRIGVNVALADQEWIVQKRSSDPLILEIRFSDSNAGLEENGNVLTLKKVERAESWRDLFGNDHAVVLEIGVGNGQPFLLRSKANRHRNFLGNDAPWSKWLDHGHLPLADFPDNAKYIRADIRHLAEIAERKGWTFQEIYVDFPALNPSTLAEGGHPSYMFDPPEFLPRLLGLLGPGGTFFMYTHSTKALNALEAAVRKTGLGGDIETRPFGKHTTSWPEDLMASYNTEYFWINETTIYRMTWRRPATGPVAQPAAGLEEDLLKDETEGLPQLPRVWELTLTPEGVKQVRSRPGLVEMGKAVEMKTDSRGFVSGDLAQKSRFAVCGPCTLALLYDTRNRQILYYNHSPAGGGDLQSTLKILKEQYSTHKESVVVFLGGADFSQYPLLLKIASAIYPNAKNDLIDSMKEINEIAGKIEEAGFQVIRAFPHFVGMGIAVVLDPQTGGLQVGEFQIAPSDPMIRRSVFLEKLAVSLESSAGLEELSPRAKILDERIKEFAAQSSWLQGLQIDLNDPSVRFAVHLGANVSGSSSPPALTHLYNQAITLQGIRLVSIPLDTPPELLEETLEQIREHPRVTLVTVTQPHKIEVAKIVQRWGSWEWDQRVLPMETTNNVLLVREEGVLKNTTLTNSDGPALVEQFRKVWGRTAIEEGTFHGKNIVVLGGWGGLGQALTVSILKEQPSSLVISESVHLKEARDELPALARKLDLPKPTILPADGPALSDHLRQADVIINSTGIGANDDSSPIQDPTVFQRPEGRRLIVIDSIYRDSPGNPRPVTPFLRQAWNEGIREVHNGWGLFVRDFSWEGAWMAENLNNQSLDKSAQEAIYQAMYNWARSVRGAREANEILVGEAIRGYRSRGETTAVEFRGFRTVNVLIDQLNDPGLQKRLEQVARASSVGVVTFGQMGTDIVVRPYLPRAGLVTNIFNAAGLEEMQPIIDVETFLRQHPSQTKRVPEGTTHLLVLPIDTVIHFYRPLSLVTKVNHLISLENRNEYGIPRGLQLVPEPIPPDRSDIKKPGFLFWDPEREARPYHPGIPWIAVEKDENIPINVAQAVLLAFFQQADPFLLHLLSSWEFEQAGRRYVVIAVDA